MNNRVFLFVLDSFGVGNAPDAEKYGDRNSNTLLSLYNSGKLHVPNMENIGLFSIDGVTIDSNIQPIGQYGRLTEKSNAKDTVTGHWEMMGTISKTPFPVFPNGFPQSFIKKLSKVTGYPIICNKPYSGTEVIKDYGEEHIKAGALIVYTSADSVLQIAAHKDIVPLDKLYNICKTARDMLTDELAVGRVIARPFTGKYPNFSRDSESRHDYTITPPHNYLNKLHETDKDIIAVGKITDIFNGSGIKRSICIENNEKEMNVIESLLKDVSFNSGLCFVNLSDFDVLYGHRRNVDGYTEAINAFDKWLGEKFLPDMRENDSLIITGDHGCDPTYSGTNHTREAVPVLIYHEDIFSQNLGTIAGFDTISKLVEKELGDPVKCYEQDVLQEQNNPETER